MATHSTVFLTEIILTVHHYHHYHHVCVCVCVCVYVKCSIFTVRSFTLALNDDFFIGYMYRGMSPKWPGFMGNPDHPSSPYIPDDQGTAILPSPVLFSFLCSYSLL